jgi:signal transduction histidine kinase
MLRSLSHPLKPLLYLEWLFLALALLYPWITPVDALAIITARDGRQPSVAVGLGTSSPIGWLIPIGWLGFCVGCWFIRRSNKELILGIFLLPLLGILFGTEAGRIFENPVIDANWLLLSLLLGYFSYMGVQIEQRSRLNQWLYVTLEFLLIWFIYFVISELHTGAKANLETLLLLHLVALVRACLMFAGKQRWLAIGLFVISYQAVSIVIGVIWADLLQLFDRSITLQVTDIQNILRLSMYNVTIVFTMLTGLLIVLVNTLVSERRNREQLAQAHAQLRQYAQRIEDQTMLQERNRIAREIHDALGHTLTAQSIQLENALVHFEPEPDRAYQFITQAKALSQKALQEVRRSVSQLRTHLLAGKSFEVAIGDLITEFQQSYPCTVDCQIESIHIPIEIQTAVYRIIQEALTNIARHSGANQVTIALNGQPDPHMPLHLELQIIDNGRGFQADQTSSGFGLQGIRERASAIGGQCTIQSTIGQGCHLQLSVPLHLWTLPSVSSSSMTKP